MREEPNGSRWMDEYDPELQPGLTCHIEIENDHGKTMREVLAATACALRAVAGQIELGVLDDGFHPIRAPDGEKIGEVYLDHHETMER
jgi:hypothetical protein